MLEQVAHGEQVNLVVLAATQHQFDAFQFDLIGIEHAVDEARCGILVQVGSKVREDLACPGFVVDAGRLVTEDHVGPGRARGPSIPGER